VKQLDAAVLEARGDSGKAAGELFDVQNRLKLEILKTRAAAGDQGAAQAISNVVELRQRAVEQGNLSNSLRSYQNVLEAVGLKQSEIDLQAQTGAITEIDAINKKAEVARQFIGVLEAQA